MDSSGYDEYEAIVRVRKGARLTRSRKTAGAHRGMTRDSDTNQVGQAEIFFKKENEPDPVAAYPQSGPDHESDARAQERRERAEFAAEVLLQIGFRVGKSRAARQEVVVRTSASGSEDEVERSGAPVREGEVEQRGTKPHE
jgi:hypothetical protein